MIIHKLLLTIPVFVPAVLSAQGGQPALTSVTFQQATVAGGATAVATITISGPAGNNGFDVSLSLNSNAAQLGSSSITIGNGQTSGTVAITTTPTATLQLATLTASARNDTRTANLTIAPPSVSNLSASPGTVNSGQQSTGTVTINGQAPSGGMQVSLSSNNAALAVPPSVTVPAGQTSTTFSASAGTVSAQTSATITAATGTTARTTGVTVLPAAATLTSITLPFNPLSGEFKARAWSISAPAPPGGAFIQVRTTGVDIFQKGGSFTDTIPAGQTSFNDSRRVPVTGVDVPYEVIYTFNGVEARRSNTLRAPGIANFTIEDSVAGGRSASLRGTTNATPPSSGIPVTITSNNPSVVPSPGATSGIGSSSSVSYTIRTNPVAARQTVELTILRNAATRTISFVVFPAGPVISSFTASPTIARAGQAIALTVVLDKPASGRGLVVDFTVPAGISMPASVFFPAGTSMATVQATTTGRVAPNTSVRFTAKLDASQESVNVVINP